MADDVNDFEVALEIAAVRRHAFAAALQQKERRERIATAALVGLLADDSSETFQLAAEEAVAHADALIAELDK